MSPSPELLPDALKLSLELAHPVYDCVYLALARLRKAPLITADKRLAAVARGHRKLAGRVVLLKDLPQ